MSLKRLALLIAFLFLGLCLATSAQAKKFSLTGGGAQLHIGNGLPLPVLGGSVTVLVTGTVFPVLNIPVAPGGATAMGTTAMAIQKKLSVHPGVLSLPASQKTVGLFFSNTSVFAVGTNLKYTWPSAEAVFSTGARTGAKTVSYLSVAGNTGQSVTYSNGLASKFGGPAQFSLSPGVPSGLMPGSPITVYIKVASPPPCTHPAFFGTDAGCVSFLAQAMPTGLAAAGGPVLNAVATPGGTAVAILNGGPKPGRVVLKAGAVPTGTISIAAFTGPSGVGLLNIAASRGFPWTTGKVVLKVASAVPPETFTRTGKDLRTSGGSGTIQMVSGSVSTRTVSGPNANRAWLRLILGPLVTATPATSPAMLAVGAGLMMLAAGYVVRRSASASR